MWSSSSKFAVARQFKVGVRSPIEACYCGETVTWVRLSANPDAEAVGNLDSVVNTETSQVSVAWETKSVFDRVTRDEDWWWLAAPCDSGSLTGNDASLS